MVLIRRAFLVNSAHLAPSQIGVLKSGRIRSDIRRIVTVGTR
jgi:hypothetical protein